MNSTGAIRIIATSDLHGKLLPWDYVLNQESKSGSMAQLSTALKEFRSSHTLLVDAGDTIQDNFAELFLDETVHPMVRAMNYLHYDVCVNGNHDYNFGMKVVRKWEGDDYVKIRGDSPCYILQQKQKQVILEKRF